MPALSFSPLFTNFVPGSQWQQNLRITAQDIRFKLRNSQLVTTTLPQSVFLTQSKDLWGLNNWIYYIWFTPIALEETVEIGWAVFLTAVVVCFLYIATQMLNILPCLCRQWKPSFLSGEALTEVWHSYTETFLTSFIKHFLSSEALSWGTIHFLQLICYMKGILGRFLCLGLAPNLHKG